MSSIVVLFKGVKTTKWSDRDIRIRMLAQMNHYVSVLKKDYELTTATWNTKPKFEAIEAFSPSGPSVLVGTDDKIYQYVDEGTKPHLIFPRKAKALFFMSPSTAKTKPNWIGSGPGSNGNKKNVVPFVHHPGNAARNFTKILQKKHQPAFQKSMQDVLTQWAEEDK
jgi:hypothetical protein